MKINPSSTVSQVRPSPDRFGPHTGLSINMATYQPARGRGRATGGRGSSSAATNRSHHHNSNHNHPLAQSQSRSSHHNPRFDPTAAHAAAPAAAANSVPASTPAAVAAVVSSVSTAATPLVSSASSAVAATAAVVNAATTELTRVLTHVNSVVSGVVNRVFQLELKVSEIETLIRGIKFVPQSTEPAAAAAAAPAAAAGSAAPLLVGASVVAPNAGSTVTVAPTSNGVALPPAAGEGAAAGVGGVDRDTFALHLRLLALERFVLHKSTSRTLYRKLVLRAEDEADRESARVEGERKSRRHHTHSHSHANAVPNSRHSNKSTRAQPAAAAVEGSTSTPPHVGPGGNAAMRAAAFAAEREERRKLNADRRLQKYRTRYPNDPSLVPVAVSSQPSQPPAPIVGSFTLNSMNLPAGGAAAAAAARPAAAATPSAAQTGATLLLGDDDDDSFSDGDDARALDGGDAADGGDDGVDGDGGGSGDDAVPPAALHELAIVKDALHGPDSDSARTFPGAQRPRSPIRYRSGPDTAIGEAITDSGLSSSTNTTSSPATGAAAGVTFNSALFEQLAASAAQLDIKHNPMPQPQQPRIPAVAVTAAASAAAGAGGEGAGGSAHASAALQWFAALGVNPYLPDSKASCSSRLFSFAKDELGWDTDRLESLYPCGLNQFGQWYCRIDIAALTQPNPNAPPAAGANALAPIIEIGTNKSAARERACAVALETLKQQHRQQAASLSAAANGSLPPPPPGVFIPVPSASDSNPVAALNQWLKAYSQHRQSTTADSYQTIPPNPNQPQSVPLFECTLTFHGHILGTAVATTKKKAREIATKHAFDHLRIAISQLPTTPPTAASKS